MNRRDFFKALGVGTASLAIPGCMNTTKQSEAKASADRPNILFCISDDQSWLHTSINGDKADGIKKNDYADNCEDFLNDCPLYDAVCEIHERSSRENKK